MCMCVICVVLCVHKVDLYMYMNVCMYVYVKYVCLYTMYYICLCMCVICVYMFMYACKLVYAVYDTHVIDAICICCIYILKCICVHVYVNVYVCVWYM